MYNSSFDTLQIAPMSQNVRNDRYQSSSGSPKVKRTRRTFTLVAQLFRKQTYKLMYAGIVADAAGTNLIFSFLKTTAVTTGSRRVTTQKQFSSSRTSGTQRSRSPWYLTLSHYVHRAISLFIDFQSVSEKYSFFHARGL